MVQIYKTMYNLGSVSCKKSEERNIFITRSRQGHLWHAGRRVIGELRNSTGVYVGLGAIII